MPCDDSLTHQKARHDQPTYCHEGNSVLEKESKKLADERGCPQHERIAERLFGEGIVNRPEFGQTRLRLTREKKYCNIL